MGEENRREINNLSRRLHDQNVLRNSKTGSHFSMVREIREMEWAERSNSHEEIGSFPEILPEQHQVGNLQRFVEGELLLGWCRVCLRDFWRCRFDWDCWMTPLLFVIY